MRPKLCYVLPEMASNTHMSYNTEFVRALSRTTDLYLIVEKGVPVANPLVSGGKTRFVRTRNPVLRLLKTYFFLIDARLRGHMKTYVHYSFAAAFLSFFVPDMKTYYWNCGMPWQYKRPFLQEAYERLVYSLIDYFVTGAAVLVPQYAKYYNFPQEKAIVIPNWIDVDAFRRTLAHADSIEIRERLTIPKESTVLFFLQRLSERKGAYHLPSILAACGPDTVLVVAGDGPYKATLIAEFISRGVYDRVRMVGKVPNSTIVELFSVADIFLLPSDEEGIPHALLEAMAAGKATVSCDVGGVKEMYPEAFREYIVPAKDTNAIIEKVKQLLASDSLREALGKGLRAEADRFEKKKILNLFEQKILGVTPAV